MKHQKHLALLLGCTLLITTCIMPAPKASAAKIKLNKKKLVLQVKQTYTLKLKNCKKKIKWSSSKKKVASVTSKGKVKAKKTGQAIITAKAGKKKYTCKVTVKKTVNTLAPKNTPKPQNTPPQTPAASSTPTQEPSATPDIAEELAKNVSIERQVLPEHIILTVTNQNSVWLDTVTIKYAYYGLDNTRIADGYEDLYYMRAGESRYIAIPTANDERDNLDLESSFADIEVEPANPDAIYSNQDTQLEITQTAVDYTASALTLNLKNHSSLAVKGNYTLYFYDSSKNLLDISCYPIDLDDKGQQSEIIDMPSQTESYALYQKSANSCEEINDTTMLAKGVSAVAMKLTDCILVTVTNANTEWLNWVDIDYAFYDAEDNAVGSSSGSLASMAPGETQYLVLETDAEELAEIDLNYSVANISLEAASPEQQYQNTNQVTASIETTEEGYTILFTNATELPVDGSCLILFRDNQNNIITAMKENLSILATDSYELYLDIPTLSVNGNAISLAPLATSDIQIFAHTSN